MELRRIFDIIDYLLDDKVGIIHSITELPREAGNPDFFHYYASAYNTGAFCGQKNFAHTGGASIHREIAIAKAMGEAVERYCSAIYHKNLFPLESYASASFDCAHPDEFAIYSREQYNQNNFAWSRFNTSTYIRWTPAMDMLTGKQCHLPASMVYVPYFYEKNTRETPIAQPISTGLACHCSYAEAAIAGIYETIERDAFTIFWQAQTSPPQLRVETLSNYNYELLKRFERDGSTVTMLNITTDVEVPTILSVLSCPEPASPALVFAAATSLDPEEAARKSLEELAHTRRYSRLIKTYTDPFIWDPPAYHNIKDQTGHLAFWADHDNEDKANFAFASEERIDFGEIKDLTTGTAGDNLKKLCSLVNSLNHRVLIADLTTPDIRDLGLSVIHALIPGFHPLYMGHTNRALGGERLWTTPQKLGYTGITPESGDNPYPHPYP